MAIKISKLFPQKENDVLNARPLDYVYDSTFIVSSKQDYDRAMAASFAVEAEFQKCPIFPTMFSEGEPRTEIVLKRLDRVPPWIDKSWEGRQMANMNRKSKRLDIGGADRYRFFRRPIVPFLQIKGPTIQFAKSGMEEIGARPKETVDLHSLQNRSTQTDYRESETQTLPWAPPISSHSASLPEILTLASLSYGHGLPAGMHEVEIIERARRKRAWEKLMPTSGDAECIELMRHMIDTMERDEWLFRETEIQTINEMRLSLAQQILKEIQQRETDNLNDRLQRYWLSKQEEKKRKIEKIRNTCNRELRKLALRHKNVSLKYHETNVVEEHRDHRSELYGPQMRFGEHPKRRHEVINVRSRFLTHIKGLEILETMPSIGQQPTDHLTSVPQKKGYELCVRETRWTEAVLKQLHQDLRDIRTRKFERPGPLRLIQRIPKPEELSQTPGIEGVTDEEEEVYQSSIFLQKIIKGRAIQTLMCKGRRKYQELIEEMKSTTALQHADMLRIAQEREHVELLQREQMFQQRQEIRVKEIMEYMEGQTLSSMLDFLSKELLRLQDERRIHAFAMLAERERYKREAAEAGRRQAEERRRREHDDMFKQLLKVHQDTVDIYLEDLVMESMNWVSEGEARHQVRELARKIDKAAEDAQLRQNDLEQEELVADLIHNFVVPEVQKQIIRKQMKDRQSKYLQEAHACIYDKIDVLPPIEEHEERMSKDEQECIKEEEVPIPEKNTVQEEIKTLLTKALFERIEEMEGKEEEIEEEEQDKEKGEDDELVDGEVVAKKVDVIEIHDHPESSVTFELPVYDLDEDIVPVKATVDYEKSEDKHYEIDMENEANVDDEQNISILESKTTSTDNVYEEDLKARQNVSFEDEIPNDEPNVDASKPLKIKPKIGFKDADEEIDL